MAEDYPSVYAQTNFDRFFDHPETDDLKREYLRRGLIPTNNLHLWIRNYPDNQPTDELDLWDYRKAPFGGLFEDLKTTHSDVWEKVIESKARLAELNSRYRAANTNDQDTARPEMKALETEIEDCKWQNEANCSEIFNMLAPQMAANGYDPLVVCI